MRNKSFGIFSLVLFLVMSIGLFTGIKAQTGGFSGATYANGEYNFKFSSSELRHTFMAAAEDYLLHNQYAGVPIFADAGFSLFSNRIQLTSEEYKPVMGFGTDTSTMSVDDSAVLMEDGKPGKAGEYTYRAAIAQNPDVWNHWIYQDATTSDVMSLYLDSLYKFEFNEDKSGYVVNPSMAEADPIPVGGRELPSGKIVSKKWQVKIRKGLKWVFNSKTDTSAITKLEMDATDFYETYKIALTEKWFRAVSGGGDFCTSSQKILNAQEFVDGKAEWEDVGIRLVDDYTLEFEYAGEQSEWDVKYSLSSFVTTPINLELYHALGDAYGTDEKTIGYHGVYYVDYYENDKVIRLKKNELNHDADKYFYTGRTITIITEAEMRFQEFLAGKLDSVGLPAPHYEEYKNHPGLKHIPGATTFRIMINGLGTKEALLKKFPDTEWTPEPILANDDFRKGMYYALDRVKLAEGVMKTSEAQMYLFTDAYLVDAELGIAYRDTPQGKSVGADLSPSTHGYNIGAARAYFDRALKQLVADGIYKSGDVIEIEFLYFSGSETQEMMASYIKDAFEIAFSSSKYNIKVVVDIMPKEFPGIYYDYMMTGKFDTSIGGISGSTLDAASFLDVYCSDNRGGFTLNWGFDTNTPEIIVSYTDDEGKQRNEIWSFDAIASALNGDAVVVDGKDVR